MCEMRSSKPRSPALKRSSPFDDSDERVSSNNPICNEPTTSATIVPSTLAETFTVPPITTELKGITVAMAIRDWYLYKLGNNVYWNSGNKQVKDKLCNVVNYAISCCSEAETSFFNATAPLVTAPLERTNWEKSLKLHAATLENKVMAQLLAKDVAANVKPPVRGYSNLVSVVSSRISEDNRKRKEISAEATRLKASATAQEFFKK